MAEIDKGIELLKLYQSLQYNKVRSGHSRISINDSQRKPDLEEKYHDNEFVKLEADMVLFSKLMVISIDKSANDNKENVPS
jgi:hypothetical protein